MWFTAAIMASPGRYITQAGRVFNHKALTSRVKPLPGPREWHDSTGNGFRRRKGTAAEDDEARHRVRATGRCPTHPARAKTVYVPPTGSAANSVLHGSLQQATPDGPHAQYRRSRPQFRHLQFGSDSTLGQKGSMWPATGVGKLRRSCSRTKAPDQGRFVLSPHRQATSICHPGLDRENIASRSAIRSAVKKRSAVQAGNGPRPGDRRCHRR